MEEQHPEDAQRIPGHHTPWYESNLLWAPVTLGVGTILTVVAAMKHDLRWLLIFAWVCFAVAAWVIGRRLSRVWWITGIAAFALTGIFLWMNWWLRPPMANTSSATSQPQLQPGTNANPPQVVPMPNATPPKAMGTIKTFPQLAKPKSTNQDITSDSPSTTTKRKAPTVTQNCPGGICAGGDISGSPTIVNPGPPPPTITTCVSEPQVVNVATGETRQVYTMTTSAEVTGPTYGFQFSGNILAKGTTSGSPDMAMNMREASEWIEYFCISTNANVVSWATYKC